MPQPILQQFSLPQKVNLPFIIELFELGLFLLFNLIFSFTHLVLRILELLVALIFNHQLIVLSLDDFIAKLFLEFLVEVQHELSAKQGILYQYVDYLFQEFSGQLVVESQESEDFIILVNFNFRVFLLLISKCVVISQEVVVLLEVFMEFIAIVVFKLSLHSIINFSEALLVGYEVQYEKILVRMCCHLEIILFFLQLLVTSKFNLC